MDAGVSGCIAIARCFDVANVAAEGGFEFGVGSLAQLVPVSKEQGRPA